MRQLSKAKIGFSNDGLLTFRSGASLTLSWLGCDEPSFGDGDHIRETAN